MWMNAEGLLWQISRPEKIWTGRVTLINEAYTHEELAELIQGRVPSGCKIAIEPTDLY